MVRAARRWLVGFAALSAFSGAAAAGEAQVEPIRLSYSAYAGCPDPQAFFAEL